MLALTHATGPSVLQMRGPGVLPEDVSSVVVAALCQYEAALATGPLVVVEVKNRRCGGCHYRACLPGSRSHL